MDFLLISGPQASGKTSLIRRMHTHFISQGYNIIHRYFYHNNDFRCVLEKNGRKVLMQSDTDLPGCILNLKNYYASYPDVDVIITACRNDPDPMRNRLFGDLHITALGNIHFEVPLGRMPRGALRTQSVAWYEAQVDKIAIMAASAAPFNI
ncbi:MAG: hypothetical protein V4456_16635 [Bacteroidota bacterium]